MFSFADILVAQLLVQLSLLQTVLFSFSSKEASYFLSSAEGGIILVCSDVNHAINTVILDLKTVFAEVNLKRMTINQAI